MTKQQKRAWIKKFKLEYTRQMNLLSMYLIAEQVQIVERMNQSELKTFKHEHDFILFGEQAVLEKARQYVEDNEQGFFNVSGAQDIIDNPPPTKTQE